MFKFKNRAYTSETDQFLRDFNERHPEKTKSVQAEVDKANSISQRRDDPNASEVFDDTLD